MHNHHHDHQGSNLGLAFFLNLIFTIIEFVGGIFTNSLAILSDAIHDLGDSISLGIAWYLEKVSNKPSDQKYTYGYKRFSVLGAIITSVILIVGSIIIIQNAIPRLLNPQPVSSPGMILLAVLGIVFNGLGFLKTHHGHSHNEKLVSLHLLEDLLGWVAVLIGGIIIYFTGWYYIDPILSLMIAVFIMINVFRNIRQTMSIILQGTPENVNIDDVESKLLQISDVKEIHDLHIWSMDGSQNILTAHVVVDDQTSVLASQKLKMKIYEKMRGSGIHHCTLEIEREGEECNLENHSDHLTC